MESSPELYKLHDLYYRRKVVIAVLTENDIELIGEWRSELLSNRKRRITVKFEEIEYDPIDGTEIGRGEGSRDVEAVVTELSLRSQGGAITEEGGVVFKEGDVKFDVSIELVDDIARDIEQIEYDGLEYEIIGIDKKGIGRRNRYEYMGRLIA